MMSRGIIVLNENSVPGLLATAGNIFGQHCSGVLTMNDSTTSPGKVYIYSLTDPFTGEIRYVGKSIRPRERLANQCNEKSNTHRCHWIQSVLAKGGRPIQTILEELSPDADWQEAEKRWIAYGREQGWPLTNGTDGGDGVPGLSGEAKERLLKTWKGRKHKPESLLKIGAASRNRKHTPEWSQLMHDKMKGRVFSPDHLQKISRSLRKLTDDQVRDIRRALANGELQKQLAVKYGVDKGTISNIKRKVSYGDVPDEEIQS